MRGRSTRINTDRGDSPTGHIAPSLVIAQSPMLPTCPVNTLAHFHSFMIHSFQLTRTFGSWLPSNKSVCVASVQFRQRERVLHFNLLKLYRAMVHAHNCLRIGFLLLGCFQQSPLTDVQSYKMVGPTCEDGGGAHRTTGCQGRFHSPHVFSGMESDNC
jgi:hypothetical protein